MNDVMGIDQAEPGRVLIAPTGESQVDGNAWDQAGALSVLLVLAATGNPGLCQRQDRCVLQPVSVRPIAHSSNESLCGLWLKHNTMTGGLLCKTS